MRIVGGRFGGQPLPAPVPRGARPTSDRVREAIASALDARSAFADAVVLDLFAGSGALGLEALSRGAARLLSVDQSAEALRAVKRNAAALGVQAATRAERVDLLAEPSRVASRLLALDPGPFDLLLLDPPYAEAAHCVELLDALSTAELLADGALAVLEHPKRLTTPCPVAWRLLNAYRYGDTSVALYERARRS